MSDAVGLALALLLPALLGAGLLRVVGLRLRHDPLAWCAWWLLASTTGTALVSAAWLAAGGGVGHGVFVAVGAVAAALHLAARRRAGASPPGGADDAAAADATPAPATPPATPPAAPAARTSRTQRAELLLWRATVGAVLVLAAASGANAHARALVAGDDAAFWAPKARLLHAAAASERTLNELVETLAYPAGYWRAFTDRVERAREGGADAPVGAADLRDNTHHAAHLDYPLLDPLLQWWCFVGAGRPLDGGQRVPLQLVGLALLLLLASALRQVTRPLVAAALLLLVAGLPHTRTALTTAYADGLVAAGLLLTVDALRRAPRLARSQWCLLATLGLTLLAGSKNEGAVYAALLLGALALHDRSRLRTLLPWLAAPAALLAGTLVFNRLHGFENDLAGDLAPRLERVPEVLAFFWREVWSLPLTVERRADLNTNGLLLAALLAWALRLGRTRGDWRAVAGLLLALATAVHLAVYVATPHGLAWQLPTSAARVSWHLVPLAALWLGALWGHGVARATPIVEGRRRPQREPAP